MIVCSMLEHNDKIEFARAKFSVYGTGKYMHEKVKSIQTCLKMRFKKANMSLASINNIYKIIPY